MTAPTASAVSERYPPSPDFVAQARISGPAAYSALVEQADQDRPAFWAHLARQHLRWQQPFTVALDQSEAPFYRWFTDGKLNVSVNCLDRHLDKQPEKPAFIFEADDGTVTTVSYRELHRRVCRLANALRQLGVTKGERVVIYLPTSIEAVVAMQACNRIGAIHSVVFGGFSARSLQERIVDAGAALLITAD